MSKITMLCMMGMLLLTGCAREADSDSSSIAGAGKTTEIADWKKVAEINTPTPTEPARSPAEQWAEKLQDPATRNLALRNLVDLGEQGYPALYQGMKDPSPAIRLGCIREIHNRELVEHRAETMPQLIELLHDQESLAVRQASAIKLSMFSGPDRNMLTHPKDPGLTEQRVAELQKIITELRSVADKVDEDTELRNISLTSARALHWAVTGKHLPCEKALKGQPVQKVDPE